MNRLYGNIKNLEYTGGNSTCNYYKLTLYFKFNNQYIFISAESGFLYYTKKEIYNLLKNIIIGKIYNEYGVIVA